MVSISIDDELEGASTPLSLDALPQSDLVAMVKVRANSMNTACFLIFASF